MDREKLKEISERLQKDNGPVFVWDLKEVVEAILDESKCNCQMCIKREINKVKNG